VPLNLEKLRKLCDGRQATVAIAAGMHQPSLSRILSGRKPDVPISTIDRLAKALGVRARDLID